MAVTLSQQAEVSVRCRAGGGGSPLTAAPELSQSPWLWPCTSMSQGEMRIILENAKVGLERARLLGNHLNFKTQTEGGGEPSRFGAKSYQLF